MSMVRFLNEASDRESPDPDTALGKILGNLSTTIPSADLPVRVETSRWETLSDPERLSRTFLFSKINHLNYFVNELLMYQENYHHHAIITIDYRYVTVETYTRDIDSVTRQDINLSKFCDEIFNDIRLFEYSNQDG